MVLKKSKQPFSNKRSLPTSQDLKLAIQVLAIYDFDNVGMGPLLVRLHHEIGMPIESIAKSWKVTPGVVRTWMNWYKLQVIKDSSCMPVRPLTVLKQARLAQRVQFQRTLSSNNPHVNTGLGDDQSLDLFLKKIGSVPLLTRREECELSYHIQNGSKEDRSWSLHEMTESNLRFVVSIAKRYQGHGLSLADLIDEGAIGCMKAAGRFDPTRGFKFISYAVWWIRQVILQALSEQSRIVRLPLNRQCFVGKVYKASVALEQDLSRAPELDELAAELGVQKHDVFEAQQLAHSHMSLDAPLDSNEHGSNSLIQILEDERQASPDEALLRQSLRLEIEKVLESLTPREAEVLTLYFGLGREKALTLEEIGARFSLTRERVRQIKEKAIRRMQHASRSRALRSYLNTSS